MKKLRIEGYDDLSRRLYGAGNPAVCREVTIQITGDCNLRCSYCYEGHKCHEAMKPETGKRIVDMILDMAERNGSEFINRETKAIVLSFIGGEPLLEAARIEEICDAWFDECFRRGRAELAAKTRISFATNGIAWFTPAAQHLVQKYHELMSVTVSIDGVQTLHDMHRVDANGNGSFAKAYAAFADGKKYGWYNSKMTFVPKSLPYLFESVKMMVNEGCAEIVCGCAFEPEYTVSDARVLYAQLKALGDWLIETRNKVIISMLDPAIGNPDMNDCNFCGGTGQMLAFDPDGGAYPCIRYAPVSIGAEAAKGICLGSVAQGLYQTPEQRAVKEGLESVTKTSQSPQKCLDCPVASGCGWCSALNYQMYGTPNRRWTGICLAHKARVLAACYYFNKRYINIGDVYPKKVHLPRDETEMLLGEGEAAELFGLEQAAREAASKEGEK